jgi:hypothetical protein
VQNDHPTVPNLRPYESGADEQAPGMTPMWPVAGGAAGGGMRGRRLSASTRDLLPAALAISLGVNIALLVGLVGVLLLARAGSFAPGPPQSSAQSTQGAGTANAALSSPSPTPLSGWLQVVPSSVQVSCSGDGQQTQSVVLTNSGPQDVQWQASFDVPTNQAGIEVAPNQGDLQAGASTTIQIRNRTRSANQQGVIHFDPQTPAAGPSASLTYTSAGCQ